MNGDADDHDHIDANGSVPFSLPGPPRTASIPATSGSDLTSPSEGDVYTFPDSLLLDSFFWANVAFHERETDAARDATLKRMLDSLGLRVLLLRYQTMSLPGRMSASLEDHQRLLRAYEERDAKLASVLAPAIIEGAYRSLVSSGWPSAEATA
jgi:DNA-binding GntR family transcriptional regulator